MKSLFATTSAVSVIGLLASAAAGETVALQAQQDTTLYQDNFGMLGNGSGSHFFAGTTAGFAARRGLIAFDVASAIPQGAVINSVSLTLHMSLTTSGAQDVALHMVTSAWGEGASDALGNEGGGAPALAGDATWLHSFFADQFWTSAGGDFNPLASAMRSVDQPGFYTWGSTAALVADVQGWLDQPGSAFGWALLGNEQTPQTSKRFDSSENIDAGLRPVLMVDYTVVPAPAAIGLLGCLMRKVRRR